jgi:hypothetical protein
MSAALAYTTNNFPESTTMPVRSKTPLASNDASYSIYSATVGLLALATAILTVLADALRLHKLIVATVKVSAGQVYTVVFVVDEMSNAPNLPVAI